MSLFLPELSAQSGIGGVAPANPQTSDEDIALMERVFAAAASRPNMIPEGFMSYFLDWLQTQRLEIPVGQIPGFRKQQDIRGRITSAGAITSGTGFTVSKLGTGNYQITFNTPLSFVPATNATVDDNSAGTFACKVANASVSLFQVLTYDLTGTLTDAGFYFSAAPFA